MTNFFCQPTLSLDVGGSHVTASVVQAPHGSVLLTPPVRFELHEDHAADRLLDAWAQVAVQAWQHCNLQVQGIGVGMPGPFDYQTSEARFTGKFRSLNGVQVTEELRQRWAGTPLADLPLHYLNDAAAFTLGEAVAGFAKRDGRVLGITLGTGLGSGFVIDRHVLAGGMGIAREGQIGWEPYLDATAEDYVSTGRLKADYWRWGGERISPAEIARRAEQGDDAAQQVFRQFGTHLGSIVSEWVQRFSPDAVVFGGGISRAWGCFSPQLTRQVPSKVKLYASHLMENAALIGAAAHTQSQLDFLLLNRL
ncbi:ROK family protein [Deinococcus roseus]|uniref:Glucokinase n=1 Tax=Deinococcus roseus TaxID=392414 RepID=A0ABQ2D4S1_9DEIO|nr:ROK family protein [Deinococcus roseus]GGJ43286.1 glucokinase [Deinococcus roseus]